MSAIISLSDSTKIIQQSFYEDSLSFIIIFSVTLAELIHVKCYSILKECGEEITHVTSNLQNSFSRISFCLRSVNIIACIKAAKINECYSYMFYLIRLTLKLGLLREKLRFQ